MNFQQAANFYKENPFMLLFVFANILANSMCATLMSNFSTLLGFIGGVVAITLAVALAVCLPIIGLGASEAINKGAKLSALIICAAWLAFSAMDLAMSYTSTVGRFEYAKLYAAKTSALSQTYADVAQTSAKTLDDCVRWKNCDSQDRMDTATRAAEKLEKTDIAWTPHATLGDEFVNWLVIGLAMISSLGGSIMGFISGMGLKSCSDSGKQNLRAVA